MNLKNKTNAQLLSDMITRREHEKEFVTEFLHYLKETEERDLQLEKGFSSMYAFCTEFLGYSKDEAHIRIQAMRLLRALPETDGKIKTGTLTLSSAAKIQGAFKREDQRRKGQKLGKLSLKEKKEVVQTLEAQSSRECERTLAEIFPESHVALDRTKTLPNGETLVQYSADAEHMQVLERLKEIFGHKNFDGRLDLLHKEIALIALKQVAPESKKPRAPKKQKQAAPASNEHDQQQVVTHGQATANAAPAPASTAKPEPRPHQPHPLGTPRGTKRQRLSVHVERLVKRKANYGCQYVDPVTGKSCNSRHAIEIDHIVPLALGGGNEPENLRVLCAQQVHGAADFRNARS